MVNVEVVLAQRRRGPPRLAWGPRKSKAEVAAVVPPDRGVLDFDEVFPVGELRVLVQVSAALHDAGADAVAGYRSVLLGLVDPSHRAQVAAATGAG